MVWSARATGLALWSLGVLVGGGLTGSPAHADPDYSTTVRGGRQGDLPEERATSTVNRAELDRRLPRSAPDALRWEPGVFVQQTAHGQGSAYLRGLTGQQTVLLFDGIRLNNATYRQGPNQYFFTLDSQTIDSIEILRGGASTRYGSDALGGVIAAYPTEPVEPLATGGAGNSTIIRPRLMGRFTTADSEKGGRADLMLSLRRGRLWLGFFGGAGGRDVGLLDGPRVENPIGGTPRGAYPDVPRYGKDGRTQLGTGFNEITADGRLALRWGSSGRLVLATYHYLQRDAPRTDLCPPPAAQYNVCTTYEQQFRHLTYLSWEGSLPHVRRLRVTLSHQRQHERRREDDPNLFIQLTGEDDVDSFGLTAQGQSEPLAGALQSDRLRLILDFGLDAYLDQVRSRLVRVYTNEDSVPPALWRPQYRDGSRYVQGGAYLDGLFVLPRQVRLRAGVRYGFAQADAPPEQKVGSDPPMPDPQSRPLARGFYPFVGHLGLEWLGARGLSLRANMDHSYRAPNLNDLTARQQTGPGFQFENPDLLPERATTFEIGGSFENRWLRANLWTYETVISDRIEKGPRRTGDCPVTSPQCQGAWAVLQLVNVPGLSEIRGVEGGLRLTSPFGLVARATLSYTWGEGSTVGDPVRAGGVMLGPRAPISRIPPLNGTVEVSYTPRRGLDLAAGLRWATRQDRLAAQDYSDGRIPLGGTPGFAVLDLRLAYRVDAHLQFAAVFENVTDSPYRYHGSSVNGAGRGLMFTMKVL